LEKDRKMEEEHSRDWQRWRKDLPPKRPIHSHIVGLPNGQFLDWKERMQYQLFRDLDNVKRHDWLKQWSTNRLGCSKKHKHKKRFRCNRA
jgi:hypothetical protein